MQETRTQTTPGTSGQSRAMLRIEGMFRAGQQSLQERNRRVQMLRDAIRHHAHHMAHGMSHHAVEMSRAALSGDGEAVSHALIQTFLKGFTNGVMLGLSEAVRRTLRQNVTSLDKTIRVQPNLSPESSHRIRQTLEQRRPNKPEREARASSRAQRTTTAKRPRKTPEQVLRPTRTPAPPMPHI